MKFFRQFAVLGCFAALAAPSAHAVSTTTLMPTDDVGASGNATASTVKASTWNHGFLRFDLGATSNVTSAVLRMHADSNANLSTRAWAASSDNWTESSSAPSSVGYFWYATEIAGETSHAQGSFDIDVTAFVKSQSQSDGIASFEISNNGMRWHPYSSRQGSNPPQLIVTSADGQAANLPPQANISASSTSAPAPATLTFDASGSTDSDGFITDYIWNFGDGQSAQGEVVSHNYSQPGRFEVSLTVVDNRGGSMAKKIDITIEQADTGNNGTTTLLPTDDIGAGDSGNNLALNVNAWDHAYLRFDLGSVSQVTSARLRVHYNGTSPQLVTRAWAADSDNWQELVQAPAEVGYLWYGTEKLGELTHESGYFEMDVTDFIRRQANSDGIASFELSNDSMTYQPYGARESANPPQLVILGNGGGTGGNNQAPQALISSNITSGVAPLTVNFDASGSTDADGFVFGYDWDFGDTGNANSVTPIHTFSTPGIYTVTMIALDNEGATDTTTTIIEVTAPAGNIAPTAEFSATPTLGNAPLSVMFDASNSSDSDGNITGYEWDFGNGPQLSGLTPVHTFAQAGQHLVTLVVIDNQGARSTPASLTVTATGSNGGGNNGSITEETEQSIYFIGNSVTDGVRYQTLDNLAEGAGKTHDWGRHMIPGAPLQWNWNHPNAAITNPPYGGYQQALTQHQWKSISLQPYDRSLAVDLDYADRFMDLALGTSPNAQVYIFAFYPRLNQGEWESQWLADNSVNTSRAFFQDLADGLTAANPQAKPVLQFPVGEVMYRLKQRIDAGQIAGLNSIVDLYSDNVHLNGKGEFIVGMTVYSMLYKADPSGLSFAGYAGVDAALANTVQQLAWTVVKEYLPQ